MAKGRTNDADGRAASGLGPVSDGANSDIAMTEPYAVKVAIEGTAALIFHAWNVEAVKEKAGAAKGSRSKKEDNVESYVYRDDQRHISVPGEYIRQSIINAAKFAQDPRSPRKSAMDLFKAGVVVTTELAPVLVGPDYLPVTSWQYLDQRRVVVQRNGVNRVRPAFHKGWRAEFEIEIITPEYIPRDMLRETITKAGRLIGLADFRPTYGRYSIIHFD